MVSVIQCRIFDVQISHLLSNNVTSTWHILKTLISLKQKALKLVIGEKFVLKKIHIIRDLKNPKHEEKS